MINSTSFWLQRNRFQIFIRDSAKTWHSIAALCHLYSVFIEPSSLAAAAAAAVVRSVYHVRPQCHIVSWDLQIHVILTTTVFWMTSPTDVQETCLAYERTTALLLHFVSELYRLVNGHETQ